MTKEKFNPQEWLQDNKEATIEFNQHTTTADTPNNNIVKEVEEITSRIEGKSIDIASAYSDWRDIGFALSDGLGESGREFFHRISKFYPDYQPTECDKQYDKCLKSKKSGITVKTLFHLAKQAGINIATTSNEQLKEVQLPLIPSNVYNNLPDFLVDVCNAGQSDHEKDILLLGSLATVSSCIPNVYGIYDNRKVYANMYLFVSAKASAGKGLLNHCRHLVAPVHRSLREQSVVLREQYERELNIYNAAKKDNPDAVKPRIPPEKMLFIPANSSATGVFQLLHDNDGKGLIFETEGDTLANTFKSDYGNYSDGFRKAFHHENISYYRRTDREHVEIEKPCLSAVLSGTPKQIVNLVPDAENGLFSRFMFYYLNIQNKWKNVFAQDFDNGLDEYFSNLGERFYELYKELNSNLESRFSFTFEQQKQFNKVFENLQDSYHKLLGDEYMATVRRLGLIAFRIALILSILRIMETGDLSRKIICDERDFNIAMSIIQILIVHAKKVFDDLPVQITPPKRMNRKQKFYDGLPKTFNRKQYVDVAEQMQIPDKSAQGYITSFIKDGLLHREKNDEYVKLLNEDFEDVKDAKDS